MKKMIISALCTALFLFVYQFLSWAMLGLHKSNMAFTPHQDEILANLEGKLQPGEYMLPGANPALSNDELNASFEKYTSSRI